MNENNKDNGIYSIEAEQVVIKNGKRVNPTDEEILRRSKEGNCTAHIILDHVTVRRFASVSVKTGEPVKDLIAAALDFFLKAAENEFGLDSDDNDLN